MFCNYFLNRVYRTERCHFVYKGCYKFSVCWHFNFRRLYWFLFCSIVCCYGKNSTVID